MWLELEHKCIVHVYNFLIINQDKTRPQLKMKNYILTWKSIRYSMYCLRAFLSLESASKTFHWHSNRRVLCFFFVLFYWRAYARHRATRREIDSQSCWSKQKLDCNYTFPIGLAPNWIPLPNQSENKIGLIQQHRG